MLLFTFTKILTEMNLKPQYFIAFILMLCFSLFACQQAEKQPSATSDQTENKEVEAEQSEPVQRNDMKIVEPEGQQMGIATLPNGNAIELITGSMEHKLSKALLSGEALDDKTFTFDAIKFNSDNTAIDEEASVFQAYNFGALLEAFPENNWAISSIVVDSDDPGKNLEASEKQVELLKNFLESQGADLGAIEFLPLGSEANEIAEEGEENKSRLVLQVRK